MSLSERSAQPISVADYLASEEASPTRSEYVRGDVYAMTGGTARHNRIVRNIVVRLSASERGGPCRTYFLDLKVRAAEDIYYYPDVAVTCGPHEGSTQVFDQPCLVVEVASPSTRRTDRGEKLVAYQSIRSLRAYLIVEQHRRQVTYYSRTVDEEWVRRDMVNEGELVIPCPESRLTFEDIYEGVELPPLRVGEQPPVSAWLVFEPVEAS